MPIKRVGETRLQKKGEHLEALSLLKSPWFRYDYLYSQYVYINIKRRSFHCYLIIYCGLKIYFHWFIINVMDIFFIELTKDM